MGLGRDMRLSAPSMAAEYARGIADEGADVIDVGMVGTEQLYWTVGARELDGGLMCTASHNPAAYTGREAREARRARALRRLGDRRAARDRDRGRAWPARGPAGADHDRGRGRRLPQGRARLHRPEPDHAAEGGARRRQRHGRADGRAAARRLPDRAGAHLLGAGRQLPGPRAEPAARGEPPLHHRQAARDRRRARHRVGRRRRPLLLHRRHRPLRGRRLPHRAARRVDPAQGAGRRDPVRRARLARRPRHGRGGRRHRAHQPRGPRLLQDAHARARRGLRRRGVGPLLLPRLLLRRLRDHPGAPDPGAALGRGQEASASCSSRCARATSSRARSTPRWRTRTGR